MNSPVQIARRCMRDPIRDLIVSRILDGTYPPGARLKEMALATECNVSQAPIREAFRELEALGLVQSERYRGTHVRDIDSGELAEAYELRILIEERAAQKAVPCSPELLTELHYQVEQMQRAQKRRDADGHANAAVHFHRALVAASGNRAFLQAWDSLQWQVRARIAVKRVISAGGEIKEFVEAHILILKALEAGEGRRAGKLLRELIDRLLEMIAEQPVRTATSKKAGARRLAKTSPDKSAIASAT